MKTQPNTIVSSGRSACASARRKRAVESFRSAAETIGPVEKDMSLFAITRGQFSMVDAVLHCLEACAPAKLSIWTWRIADYEVDVFRQLADSKQIVAGTLVIDHSARGASGGRGSKADHGLELIDLWRSRFGASSVRYVVNHSKIAIVEGNGLRLLLRGSMNLNFNPRFEQLDITEGGEDVDLVLRIQEELETLEDGASFGEIARSSKVDQAFDKKTLDLFSGVKRWAK